ncbi:hypothetical protein RI129_004089 [Pyrocoelia pectoralis]|uniref:CLIP domain-containing serine protease n=1 Tax=Pyrocoelia pectoralis TaxID=417401 RepID=A0AAN7VBN4_9COLE
MVIDSINQLVTYRHSETMITVLVFLFTIIDTYADICTTPNNEEAQCTPLYQCIPLLKGLATQDPKVIKFVNDSKCGNSSTEPLVCCGSTYTYTGNLGKIKRICGFQHSDDYLRVDNVNAAIEEFPWLAVLIYERDRDLDVGGDDGYFNEFSCAGALIGYRYVLTAAHCLKLRASTVVGVRLGEYNTKKAEDCVESGSLEECADPVQDIPIESKIKHPQYNRRYGFNDIALIKLVREAIFTDFVRPICLPTSDRQLAKVGEIMQFSGFGKLTPNGMYTNVKKKILGVLLSNEQCRKYFGNMTEPSPNVIENSICIREHHENAVHICEGDSGGPLVFSNRVQWHLEGIASWREPSCNGRLPAVFTKVSNYLSWINEHTND